MDILVAGDFCPNERIAEKIESNDYKDIFLEIKPIIDKADIALLNFECPILTQEAKPIIKQGPNLKCTKNAANVLKEVGFGLVTLANNHINDYGEIGISNTIETLKSCNISFVGVGANLKEASRIFYYKKGEETCAFINCCEQEFSIATENSAGANPLNPINQWYAIQEAKQNADYIVVIVHAGHEHCQLPSERMQDSFRFFIDNGVDAVIAHHQHCYSGYEYYKNKPIIYGLGNFCFDEKESNSKLWNEGYMVRLQINSTTVKLEQIPYLQCEKEPKIVLFDNCQKKQFENRINDLNRIIADRGMLHEALMNYYRCNVGSYAIMLQPYTTRLLISLYSRGYIPSILSKKKMISYLNYLICDSHRDRLIQYLKDKIYD